MTEAIETKQNSWIRRTYDWLLHWAETPYGWLVLFIWAFTESSFFPIPPDAFLIAMVLGARKRAFTFALSASIASALGGMFGYGIGHFLWWDGTGIYSNLAHFFYGNVPGFSEHAFLKVQALYDTWGFWVVFTAGFTPIPYKVITISAGAFDINFTVFVIASILSRSARFYLVSWLLWKYGKPIQAFIDKYFNWLSIAFVLLLAGGFVLIKFLL
ncbi:MAG: DedA family protein [Candidatus Marinimicrobia bacterium]|nr:DedA family protein [Candidatus Neomarinimicrobiota bacterium]MCF7902277.1 DedA family protein [Candidatus Neomarinimicrobiota bacterium]